MFCRSNWRILQVAREANSSRHTGEGGKDDGKDGKEFSKVANRVLGDTGPCRYLK